MQSTAAVDATTTSRTWAVAYWICQVLGWGAYTVAGLAMVLPKTGPVPGVIVGYVLFFFYSIALTHGLRLFIRRREWLSLPPGLALVRLAAAAAVVGTIQATLIIVVQSVWTWTSPFVGTGPFFALMQIGRAHV